LRSNAKLPLSLTSSDLPLKNEKGELKMPGPQHTSAERGNIYRSMEVLGRIQKQISSSEGGSFLLLNIAGTMHCRS
jgi:hypothetical protein